MKACAKCGEEFEETDSAYDPVQELGDMFLDSTGNYRADDLCPRCREELGITNLLGFRLARHSIRAEGNFFRARSTVPTRARTYVRIQTKKRTQVLVMTDVSIKIPFPRSYWVIPGKLMAGCYPGSTHPEEAEANLEGLLKCGIRRIINLMEETETNWDGKPFVPYQEPFCALAAGMGLFASCVRMPIRDMDVPSPETMKAILGEIDGSLALDHPVYIHCWGGRGRTGTVVGCYLARHNIATGQHALNMIRQLRQTVPDAHKPSPETDMQRAMVTSWKKGE